MKDAEALRYPVLVSLKLDGIRCVIRNDQPVSRTLKPIPNRFIQSELGFYPPFDGELMVGDPLDPAAFNKSTSGIMSHDGEPDFTLWVFDYHLNGQNIPFKQRLETAKEAIWAENCSRARIVPHIRVDTAKDLMELEAHYVGLGPPVRISPRADREGPALLRNPNLRSPKMLTNEQAEKLRADVEAATPGPWTPHEQGDPNEYCLLARGRWLVAFRQNGEMLPSRQNANARLIAAAPDLARLLLRYHDALAPERLAAALSEALDERAEQAGELAAKVRAKLLAVIEDGED